jgi:molybdenum-dependent DNA-binding transcriptional regulator ModE
MNESLNERFEKLIELYEEIKREVRQRDKHLFEQWKAGGFLIDSDILSMYPNLEKVVERLGDESDEEEEAEETAVEE